MELVLALLAAGPIGWFARDRRRALITYLAAWAVVFPVQTVVVREAGDLEPLYWVFNVPILLLGIGLNVFGGKLAARRGTRRARVGVEA